MTPLDIVNEFTTSRAGIEIKQLLRGIRNSYIGISSEVLYGVFQLLSLSNVLLVIHTRAYTWPTLQLLSFMRETFLKMYCFI